MPLNVVYWKYLVVVDLLPFHIAPTFEMHMVQHPLHIYSSIIQFIAGNKATIYNSLLKNIIEMKIFSSYIYCVSARFILVFLIIFNTLTFNNFDPK